MTNKILPYRILIVDDSPEVREGLCLLFEDELDLEVVGQAGNGVEALRAASALLPDVVILDIEMPIMNGFEVARAIKGGLDPPLILFISIHGEGDILERAKAVGGDGFAEKSKGWPALIIELREMLNRFPAIRSW